IVERLRSDGVVAQWLGRHHDRLCNRPWRGGGGGGVSGPGRGWGGGAGGAPVPAVADGGGIGRATGGFFFAHPAITSITRTVNVMSFLPAFIAAPSCEDWLG